MSVLPQIVAHRGASRDAPENTLAAFRLAFEQGADAIEGDFRLTRDGQLVCHHDATTLRMGGVDWIIAERTLAELKTLDVGSWKSPQFAGERIPTLMEVLGILPPAKAVVIELKTDANSAGSIIPIFQRTLERSFKEASLEPARVRVISFDADIVRACKQAMPHLDVCWLIELERVRIPCRIDRQICQWNRSCKRSPRRAPTASASKPGRTSSRPISSPASARRGDRSTPGRSTIANWRRRSSGWASIRSRPIGRRQ